MASRSEILSPLAQNMQNSTPFISPATRRQASVTAAHTPSPALPLTSINDDEAEKRQRRRSRVLEMQRRQLSSPATPSEKRTAAPLSGLSNAQLSEHYTNCIKLSAENKINAKNAFGLHLIDYMADLLRKKEMNNFQVASSTLDASAKIYAGRVDAIHSETYKVLTGLGRGAEKQDSKDVENGEGEDAEGEEATGKKRKRARKSNTIETNLKNININKFDLEFEVDPLFSKTSAEFDEGGTGGLLLNHLRVLDDSMALILDSSTIVCGTEDVTEQKNWGSKPLELKELKDLYGGVNFESLQICPQFAEFMFTNWQNEEETSFSSKLKNMAQSDHAFDLDAEPEPIPESEGPDMTCNLGGDLDQISPDNFDMEECDDGASEFGGDGTIPDRTMMIGDGKEAQVVESAMKSIKHGTVGTLMQILAAEPGEYSYFNTNLLRTWAGPEHWKLRPKSKEAHDIANALDKTQKAKKKEPFQIDYDDERDFDELFKEKRAATTLTKATLDKYRKSQTTLPEDLHYDADKLFRLFIKSNIMVKRHQSGVTEGLDDGLETYDYNNANDRENFCPVLADAEDDDDDDAGGFNFTAGANDFGSQDANGSFLGDNSLVNGTLLGGDNLVAQPRKVAKIDINYAKTAKKMDVKRLKSAMWSILTILEGAKEKVANNEQDKPQSPGGDADQPKKDIVAGDHSFQILVKELPQKISRNMTNNLSVPIAFVCLLHLANEKTLKITCDQGMTDLQICQG